MTTIRQLVNDAYRENGISQIGTSVTAEQLDEGVRRLSALILSMYGNEMGEPLTPFPIGNAGVMANYANQYDNAQYISSYSIPANSQLIVNGGSGYTVYLNPQPQDGERVSVLDVSQNFTTNPFTLDANGRRIGNDRTAVLDENGSARSWFYRADLGSWVEVTSLDADSDSPFPTEFDDLLSTSLAMRLFPRYQEQTKQETMMFHKRAKSQFRSRYRQTRTEYPEVSGIRLSSHRLSGISFETGRTYA